MRHLKRRWRWNSFAYWERGNDEGPVQVERVSFDEFAYGTRLTSFQSSTVVTQGRYIQYRALIALGAAERITMVT